MRVSVLVFYKSYYLLSRALFNLGRLASGLLGIIRRVID